MIHYVYETINLVNNKIYVGVKTNSKHFDDGYFGSGKIIQRAFKKYGLQNFAKRVLWSFSSPEEAFAKEAEIVNEEFVLRKDTYNVATGGKGGYLGIVVNEKRRQSLMGHFVSKETKIKQSLKARGRQSIRKGIPLSKETKNKISFSRIECEVAKGSKNPNAKTFKVIEPNGTEHFITGSLRLFCEEKNLSYTSMSMIANGKVFNRGKHFGWKIEIL